jgi:outer membrane protein assembly factor BamB
MFIIPAAIALAGCFEIQKSLAEPASVEETLRPALRVKADLARGRRWELGWGVVHAYDTASEQLIRSVRLPGANLSGAPETCLPDMLLSRSGALIVSSNAQPMLWRISPSHFEVERFDIEVDSDKEKDFGFSGLSWGADEKVLYAVSAVTGTLWRIDLDSAKASKVELSTPVRGACGLALAPRGGPGRQTTTLVVKIGSTKASQRISLSPDLARGEVRNVRATEMAAAK